jgi:Domain of unknown function (DUF4397)
MPRLFKVVLFGLATISLGVLSASCGSGNSQYRIFNAIANPNEPIDIYINGTTTPVYSSVSFASTEPSTGYASISASSTNMEVFQAGQQVSPWINSALNLSGNNQGNQYTVVLTGNSNTTGVGVAFAAQVFQDTNPTVTSGDVEFRIINASISAPSKIDIYIIPTEVPCCPGSPAVSGLSYGSSSGYVNVGLSTSGNLSAYMTFSQTKTQIGSPFADSGVQTGSIHTLIIADQPGGTFPPQMFSLATN